LIVPNPESALNEEAGKLLLERYDDYCRRAKMMTEIHARSTHLMKESDGNNKPSSSSSTVTEEDSSRNELGSHAKRKAGDSNTKSSSSHSSSGQNQSKSKSTSGGGIKDKRKTLKRL
jgi:ubiquitin-conjugating enzyme E2 S